MDSTPRPLTIGELAASLGVSAMTIHRAVSGKPDVSAKTRERILTEVERLGWRPNIAARGLRQGKTYTLGILVTNTVASFLPEILQGVNETAEKQGYHTFVSTHNNDPARAERQLLMLQSKGVDGIVHYPSLTGEEGAVLSEVARTTPAVVVMRPASGWDGASMVVDDRLGGRLAGRHLLELGHRSIGFVGYVDSGFSQLRREGLVEALAEAGLPLRPEWTVTDLNPGDGQAVAAARRLLTLPEAPTALFCASDRLAASAMQAAVALGRQVPGDLSLVGYNDDPWVTLLPVPLTTVAQPKLEIGVRAAESVLAETPGDRPEHLVLEPWLVRRASTAALTQ